jgi:hypothetical protein
MPGNIIYPRLCSTCKHASTCTFLGDPQRPSFYCEEFEIESVPAKRKTEEDKLQPTASFGTAEESGSLIGLCRDCENRQTCVFPKSEGGIWHCEEYR